MTMATGHCDSTHRMLNPFDRAAILLGNYPGKNSPTSSHRCVRIFISGLMQQNKQTT